jgi:hypothetical protein
MGGEVLKDNIVVENDKFRLEGEVCAWETCLWRVTVLATVKKKNSFERIEYRYEAVNRKIKIRDKRGDFEIGDMQEGTLAVLGDLLILRAINPNYYNDEEWHPFEDGDLNMDKLFKRDIKKEFKQLKGELRNRGKNPT